ncbi:PAS domain-containing protein [Flavobacterium sp. '19STA2R22 D10 B1']|uniref:PAS domain-containing protein n=1 Tax=Flavobacterium aerium TaxID=3037261 RepID=UPI00278BE9BE|nr:PAS domain-containing protein [Flavobacterium sp. '19STA2R22 D10 B1']
MLEGSNSNLSNNEELNHFYEKLLNEVPDFIFQLKIAEDGSFSFLFISQSIKEVYEFDVDEVHKDASLVLEQRILKEDYSAFIVSILKSKVELKPWTNEFRALLPTKGLRWFKGNAKPEKKSDGSVIFYGRITDVTEMKEQELKLKLSEERFQFALDATSEGIWDWDIKAKTVFYSAQSMKILDFEYDDVIDTLEKWDDLIHPDDKLGYLRDIQQHLDNKTPFYQNVQRVLNKNGQYKWILSKGKVMEYDEEGNPSRVIGTHQDITAQKEKEDEMMITLNIVSEQNSRLLNFAHIVSHNLRSHAGNFRMLLDLIETAESNQEKEETLVHLRTISNELSETIEHLKELVSIHSDLKSVKEKLNLHQYLHKVLNILGEELNKHGVLISNEIPENTIINYNPAYLESILLNFTTNAIKYSHPDRIPKIIYRFNKETFCLEIIDNGLGIDLEKHSETIFGMYKTFHKHPNSRGIGLFITKNQIESMGGRVEVLSKVGEGTTFKIYFDEEV